MVGVIVGAAWPKGGSRPTVTWGNYVTGLQSQIDSEACFALQVGCNNADANDAAALTRTGTGNADLMSYIQYRMQAKKCPGA